MFDMHTANANVEKRLGWEMTTLLFTPCHHSHQNLFMSCAHSLHRLRRSASLRTMRVCTPGTLLVASW
jgi:hypothetical protein